MRVLRIFLQFAAFVTLFLFMACTSMKFSAVWKDEAYQGRPGKILVINTFTNPATRRLIEDEFVKAMKDRRIDAVASYTLMPDPFVSNKGAITAQTIATQAKGAIVTQAKEVGADTILINRFLGAREPRESLYHEGTALEYRDGTPFEYLAGTSFEFRNVYISTQTEVFDMKSNRLVLTASSEIYIGGGLSNINLIQVYIKDLVNKMSQLGLF